MAISVVAARPTDSESSKDPESVDVRQGYNQGQQQPGYPPLQSNYPQQPNAINPYPAGSNARPAYAYDNAFPDQVNFSQAAHSAQAAHSNIASLIHSNLPPVGFLPPIPPQGGVAGFVPTGYQAPSGVVASAAVVGKI